MLGLAFRCQPLAVQCQWSLAILAESRLAGEEISVVHVPALQLGLLGSVPPTGFPVNGLRACSLGQAEMGAVFFSVQVREGQLWKGCMLKAVKLTHD